MTNRITIKELIRVSWEGEGRGWELLAGRGEVGAEGLFAWRQLTAPVNVLAGASARVLLLEEEFQVAPQGDGERRGRYAPQTAKKC